MVLRLVCPLLPGLTLITAEVDTKTMFKSIHPRLYAKRIPGKDQNERSVKKSADLSVGLASPRAKKKT